MADLRIAYAKPRSQERGFCVSGKGGYNGAIMKTKKNLIALLVVIALIAAALYWNKQRQVSPLVSLTDKEDIESQGGKIEYQQITNSTVALPDIHHVVIFKADMVPQAKEIILKNIADLQARLEKVQTDFNIWNDLALHYQAAEDYQAARDVWEYLGKAFPTNHVAFSNLGFLYGYYLKDAVRAEQDYLKAIANAPSQSYLYFQAAEFYRDIMKNIDKALAIAKKGLEQNPQNVELKQLVESLKK